MSTPRAFRANRARFVVNPMRAATVVLMTDDTTFELHDGERTLIVEGEVIAEVSSDDQRRHDWTEIRIIVTPSGSYVVNIVGCTRRPGGWEKHRTSVSVAAEGAVESLYLVDGDGARYMTNLAKTAAAQAAELDDGFRSAYLVEHVA